MSSKVQVYGFETSNNMKVRVALGYKGIPYEFKSIDPADRSRIQDLSGQFLTPVLVHGEQVVADSAAILRYLDLAFPE
ncbi:MAG: glutathione S-transferase family protein, partial [Planctomycetota bacterium]